MLSRCQALPRVSALVAAAALAAGLAACGGESGGSEDAAGFAAAADGICVEAAERDVAARSAPRDSQTAYLRRLRADRAQTLRQLAALEPPQAAAASYRGFLDARREAIAGLDEVIPEAEDAAVVEAFRVGARERVLAAQGLAAEAGLRACAGALGADERAAVGETVALSVQRARAREFCAERSSAAMVANNFAGVADCVRRQSRRSRADRAEIEELSGVDGVSANAIVTLSGAESAEYEVSLIYEDGTWKYDAVSPLPE
jgi:hypothetical protein